MRSSSARRSVVLSVFVALMVLVASCAPASKRIGEVNVLTNSSGEKVDVRILRLVDNAPPDAWSTPAFGRKLVAVELRYFNTGKKTYRPCPGVEMDLFDTANRLYHDSFNYVAGWAGSNISCSGTNLLPGSKLQGYVTFELPYGAVPSKIQMNIGYGGNTGVWVR